MNLELLLPILIDKLAIGVLLIIVGLWINRKLTNYKIGLEEGVGVRVRIAEARLPSYKILWELTIQTSPSRFKNITIDEREVLINKLRGWYYSEGQGLFLSENTRTLYLKAITVLTSKDLDKTTEDHITEVFSALRTLLKNEIGIYGKVSEYKYRLTEDYTITTDIELEANLSTEFIELKSDGELKIRKNYAWNGPQGPTVDTQSVMRGSLVHDALYQLMREHHVAVEYRGYADKLFKRTIEEDGVSKFRSWMLYKGLRIHGDIYAYSNRNPRYGIRYEVIGKDSDYQDYIERV